MADPIASENPRIRSLLFAPGNNDRILSKVFDAGSDAVDLDLEDAVPTSAKLEARARVAAVVRARTASSPLVIVRVNGPESGLTAEDLRAVIAPGLWGVHLTKLRAVGELEYFARMIGELERERGMPAGSVRVISSVDSAHLVLNLPALARATPRLYTVIAGGVDFAEDIGVGVSPMMEESRWARSYAVLVCRDAEIQPPLHPPGLDLNDPDATVRLLQSGRALGFQGAIALHPKQLPLIHSVFSPTDTEVAWARKVVDAFARSEAAGSAAMQVDGQFVDYALVKQAESILALSVREEAAV